MVKDIRNYWYPGSPLGGYNKSAFGGNKPSATNLDAYLSPLITPRIKQDPATWKDALTEAEIPQPLLSYRYKLQQMYNDVDLDGHVTACVQRRKDMTLLKDYGIFDSNGNENTEATKLITQAWFKSIMSHALDSLFFGYTLLGIQKIENGVPKDIKLIRRQNISPDRLNIAAVPYSPGGIQFMDETVKDENGVSFYDWSLWFPTPSDYGIVECGIGIYYKVALYQILLRNNLGDNTTFNELFGQPLRVGRTNKKDAESRNALWRSLQDMGSSSFMVLDEEDRIEFINSTTGSGKGNDTYDNLEQRLEKKISKIILGHADAMDSQAGKLGNSGKDEDGVGKAILDKEKKDVDYLETVMNDIAIPKLIKLGVKIPVGTRFKFKNDKEKQEAAKEKNENILAIANIAKTFKDAGLKIDAKFIEESTGIKFEEIQDQVTINKNQSKKVIDRVTNLYQ